VSHSPIRVAVQVGASSVQVAALDRGVPRLLAREPAAAARRLPALLAELFARPPDELLVVGGDPAVGARLAPVVRAVPAAVAAGRTGPRLVVDVGHADAELTLLDAAGRVRARRSAPGGARLDHAVAAAFGVPAGAARQLREVLSLSPQALLRHGPDERLVESGQLRAVLTPLLAELVTAARDVVDGVHRGGPGLRAPGGLPVLLVGGVARTPLLAELFDAAAIGPVTVAGRPESAAVLGALELPAGLLAAPAPAPAGPVGSAGFGAGPRLPVPRRRSRLARAAPALVAAAVLTAAVSAWPSSAPVAPTGVVAQYGYAMRLPEGWAHSGGLPERRRTLLTPVAAAQGSDLVVVERTALGYDAAAEPARAATDLRAAFDAAVLAGEPLWDFRPSLRHSGRPVAGYRQHAPGATVDWYVLLDLPDQVSVGCQHTNAGAAEVGRACAVVVGSVGLR